jgi:hypothetical protein
MIKAKRPSMFGGSSSALAFGGGAPPAAGDGFRHVRRGVGKVTAVWESGAVSVRYANGDEKTYEPRSHHKLTFEGASSDALVPPRITHGPARVQPPLHLNMSPFMAG